MKKYFGNRGLGLWAIVALVAVVAVLGIFSNPMTVLAKQSKEVPGLRLISVKYMTSATSTGGQITASNEWTVAANTSKYTESFTLSDAQRKMLGVNVSTTAVNSGTHVLYLQASNDGTSWGNLEDATAASAAGNQYDETVIQSMLSTVSITAIGDKAVRFSNIPPFMHYRFHMDADASNGPIAVDHLSIADY
jgi:hypothetical protein